VTRPTFRVKPDFVFPKLKVAVFVDGCFWHVCPKHCKYAPRLPEATAARKLRKPKHGRRTGRTFWLHKLAANKARDQLVNRTLRRDGWRVLRIWEHDLAKKRELRLVARLQRFLTLAAPDSGKQRCELRG
jgi:DNA mismatch endonuclease (patch repair protein)